MKRKLLLGGAFALAALLLYAAAGYWLAPRILRDALQEQAAGRGLALTMEEVRTDPFRVAVELVGVGLAGPQGNRLAGAQEIRLDLAWASLWRRAWVVQRASVHAPHAEVVLGPEGALNWPTADAAAKGGRQARALRVQTLSISEGTVRLVDRSRGAPVELVLRDLGVEVQNFATREGEAQYRLSGQFGDGGTLGSDGTFSLAPLAAHGELEVAGVPLAKASQLAAPATKPADGRLAAHARYAYEEGRLVLHDFYAEAAPIAYEGIELYKARLEVPKLAFPLGGPVQLAAQAQLKPNGSLSARGSVRPQPLTGELELEALSLPLALAHRFLPHTVALDIASGAVSGKGRVQLDGQRIAYQGSAELAELKLEERRSQRLVLGWKVARTEDLKLTASPPAVDIGELLIQAPQGRLAIEADGAVNFAEIFQGAGGGGEPLHASLRRLRIENGTLHFADRSLDTPFEVTMRELSGTVTGFSTAPADPALVELTGRVGEYGAVRIRGTIDLDQPKSLANITARFRNVGLAQLTPYVVKFAGYRVRAGRVSADLRYRVRDASLIGQNQLVFQELQLGEKVQDAGAADLPLELAVALLADPKGRITLDIPVRGNLNDPQFDFGGLVARALRNVLGKVVSAPFRALAGLFGGKGEDLGQVRFDPGSAALSPPQEENVAKVAQALAARPQLAVLVRGGYDPARDPAALRREAARREIARRAGYKSQGPLDFSDPKTLEAAESLYLERIGNRQGLQALRKDAPRYGRALLELLAYTLPEETGSAQKLARERAQSVRAALLEAGVAPARVALEPPAEQNAADEGVATQLSLTTNASTEKAGAAAGATAAQ